MKRRRILIATLLVAVLGGFAWFVLRPPPEPVYQGKPLRAWLQQYYDESSLAYEEELLYGRRRSPQSPNERLARAEEAIQQIGVDGLPTLLRMLGQEPWSPYEKFVRYLQRRSWLKSPSVPHDDSLAKHGFYVLASKARPAVPALLRMVNKGDVGVQRSAMEALGNIGPEAQEAVPGLIQRIAQTNNQVHWFAINALGKIHSNPELVVPALTNSLATAVSTSREGSLTVRLDLIALGKFGQKADSAVPAILRFVKDPDLDIQDAAIEALKSIDPAAAAKAGANRTPPPTTFR
jgi:hypothetical protein